SLNGYLFNWLNPFSFSVGLFTLALFAYLAAGYFAAEATNPEVRQAFCHRALAPGSSAGVFAAAVFLLTDRYAQARSASLLHSGLALFAEAVALVSLMVGLVALSKNHVQFGRLMVSLFGASIVTGWAAAQYPYLARPDMTIFNSALSENVVRD